LRLAAALLLTLPGTPWIYYGEEIGMCNGSSDDDVAKRLPMQWEARAGAGFTSGTPWADPASVKTADTVAGQRDDPASLLSWYRRLIRLRASEPALRLGSTRLVAAAGSAGDALVLRREASGQTIVLVYNFAKSVNTITVSSSDLPPVTTFRDLLTDVQVIRESAGAPLSLDAVEPRGVRILRAD